MSNFIPARNYSSTVTLMDDLYADGRILPDDSDDSVGRVLNAIGYSIWADECKRIHRLRRYEAETGNPF